LLNANSIRQLTGVDYHSLKYYRQRGYIKGYKVNGGAEWYYKLDNLSKFKKTKHQPDRLKNLKLDAIISTIT
jgi:hypothetical protein